MKPTPPITRPRSSFRGTRITTNDSLSNCMMSNMIGSPRRTTSRMRLLGITSSTTLPRAHSAFGSFNRAAYLSLIQTMRASRSTMIAPSQAWLNLEEGLFAARRIAAGSFRRLM